MSAAGARGHLTCSRSPAGFLLLLRVLRCWWDETSRQTNRLSGSRFRGGGGGGCVEVWLCASVTDNYSNVFSPMLHFLTFNNSDTSLQRACLVSLSWLQIIPDTPRLGKICSSLEFFTGWSPCIPTPCCRVSLIQNTDTDVINSTSHPPNRSLGSL